jgi:DNA-binding response OmpR family regulator
VTKPFSPRELVARVRAVLRRTRPPDEDAPLQVGDLAIDPSRHEVVRGDERLRLTVREFAILLALARTPGRVFSRQELRERAFGADSAALDRTVDAHVMNLRRKLEPDPAVPVYVETVFGVGYRFVARRPRG